ncbi:hypothetical protein RHSIM_Rhsim10G0063400 [Rhododendron simsii]|uniref:Uncharacterized protein n=1 Tax=Rhododendron simsii TaxID=118357 RepID=A0A834LEK7_RHOSS|nr:hypothetical protein RHSIM_Rhsim10G0063400 [Rhododendron simsii]
MVPLRASKLPLPPSLSSAISSLLFDPLSLSLSLSHPDSSLSLFPSLSPSPLSLPSPQTLIPPPSSSSTFLRLQNPTNPTTATLFLVSSPLRGGSSVLLRFYTLLKITSQFAKTHVICNQTGLNFDENKSGVVFNVSHGVSVKLVGSVNVFVMYSVSNAKVWVFAVKMMDDDGVSVKLMKCAVIDCIVPVFAVSVSYGYLMLGEENGVRVFALRPLVKGRVVKRRRAEIRELSNGKLEGQSLPNGVHHTIRRIEGEGTTEICSNNGYLEWKSDKHCDSVKLKSVNLGQDSKGGSTCFAAFKYKEVDSYKLSKVPLQPAKAISIQALSPKKFLILDSVGQLHLMCLSLPVIPVSGSDIHCHVKQLTNTMKVEKLAVLPDLSTRTQTVWISDGCHTLHMLAVTEMDTSVGEKENKDSEEKPVGISVIQAIFASEKIEDVIPLATNAVLLLGQACHSSHELQLSLIYCVVRDSEATELLKKKCHGDQSEMPFSGVPKRRQE